MVEIRKTKLRFTEKKTLHLIFSFRNGPNANVKCLQTL